MNVADELDDRLAVVAGARNAADAAAVEIVADVLDDGLWESYGLASAQAWVGWKFGVTRHRAKVLCSIAERRRELPTTFRLFGEGRLSSEQVYLIARHCPAADEIDVSQFALVATVAQLSRTLRDYHFDGGTDSPDETTPRPNRASLGFDESGRFRLHAEGDAEAGARLRAALDQYHTRLIQDGCETDPYPSTFDALMALVDAGVDADTSTSRRRRHRTLLHIDARTLSDWAQGRRPRLHLGPLVDRQTMELLTCDGDVALVLSRFGRPLRLGRSTRVIPSRLRNIIIDRDGGCRVCGRTANLDVHHVVHWSNGGPTDPSNLATVCSRCHTAHHKGEITIAGDPSRLPSPGHDGRPAVVDGLVVTNRHGLRLNQRPPPRPVETDGPPPGHRYRHPLGERLRAADVHFAGRAEPVHAEH